MTWTGSEACLTPCQCLYPKINLDTFAGFILAVFGSGVAVGRIVEKIERLDRKKAATFATAFLFFIHNSFPQ